MRARSRCWIPAFGLALAACQTTAATLEEQLERAHRNHVSVQGPRLLLDGQRVTGGAVPVASGAVPPVVRTTFEAIAPDGETTFLGREWGPRGEGFRLEKTYAEPAHVRSLLVADDGRVLERAHSLPLREVPQQVLAAALRVGRFVDEARIVSGADREEYWTVEVHDSVGDHQVVTIDLAGNVIAQRRRVMARVDT